MNYKIIADVNKFYILMCTALKLSLVMSCRPVLCRAFARVRGFGRQPAIESVLQLIILLLTGGLKFYKWL